MRTCDLKGIAATVSKSRKANSRVPAKEAEGRGIKSVGFEEQRLQVWPWIENELWRYRSRCIGGSDLPQIVYDLATCH